MFLTPPVDVGLRDSKAHQLLVTCCAGSWQAIPAPVNFTRHAGTCLLIGDKHTSTAGHRIELGDCLRLGSVGLVVVSMRLADGTENRIKPNQLACLREDSLTSCDDNDEAYRAVDERKLLHQMSTQTFDENVSAGGSVVSGMSYVHVAEDAPICYMCYDPHDTEEDPLVAPCDCRGDTRYLHVACLQKWYQVCICVYSLTHSQEIK